MEQLRAALRRYVVPRRHTTFLAAIVALFIVRSFIGYNRIATAAFSIALLLLLLFALYVVEIDELLGERQALLAQTRRHTNHRLGARLARDSRTPGHCLRAQPARHFTWPV